MTHEGEFTLYQSEANLDVADIDPGVRDRIVQRVLSGEPEAVAVLVIGSYGNG